jgi:small-conductance mechanosensitive channel
MSLKDALVSAGPFGFTLAGLALGLIVEFLVLGRLVAALERRNRPTAARCLAAFRTALPLWTTALGARLTAAAYPLPPEVSLAVQQTLGLVMLLALTLVSTRIATSLLRQYLRYHAETLPTASLISSLVGIAIWTVAVLVALQLVGIAIGPVLAALGVGGLAVALALQPTLQNLFSGLQIIASRQIKLGDYVQLESGKEGYVTDITWRTTTIRDLPNHVIIVPNATLAQASFTNFAFPQEQTSVAVTLLVGYDVDLETVERLALEVARETLARSGAQVEGFAPFLRFTDAGNENVKLTIFLRAQNSVDPFKLRSDFIKRVLKRYAAEGIPPPFPARTAPPAPPRPAPSATPQPQSTLGGLLSNVFKPPRPQSP